MRLSFVRFFLIIFCFQSFLSYSEVINSVDHKGSQLNLYLDFIKYNLQEKLGILPYILKNPQGSYLEVGTGGDPIAELLSKIPITMSPTIIASDIDQNILNALAVRHPQLQKFLNNKNSGPKLELQQLDATSMVCFPDNSLDGINASAVVHEIVSYAGGMDALDNFFSESLRVLKPNGVLIYRDPESISNKNELVEVYLKTPAMRLFVHIFLFKFLDKEHGRLALSNRKSDKYDPDTVLFTFYKKNESFISKATYHEYLKIRSYEIDFARYHSLVMPRGLCREIERHYLTYLHQCNPLVFINCFPHMNSELYFVNYFAHSTQMIFDEFLRKNSLQMSDGLIDVATKIKLNSTIINNVKCLEYGIPICFSSKVRERLLLDLLRQHNFDPNKYIIPIKENCYLLDYRIFGLLYDYIIEIVFDEINGPVNKDDVVHAEWLKREGEETYIYYSDDELITKVAEVTLGSNDKRDTCFVLCPVSAEQNKFIPRLCYEEVLRDALEIYDIFGFPIEIKEGKRIIHFAKMQLKEAIPIYENIIKSDPEHYYRLRTFTNDILEQIA